MKQHSSNQPRVGILGGGQLARMLCQAASNLGVETWVTCQNPHDPAASVCTRAVSEEELFNHADVVTFENEFVDCSALQDKATFSPSLNSIALLQDKISQKRVLAHLAIPTTPYIVYDPQNSASLDLWFQQVQEKFKDDWVLKWARFGYDGKGTLIGPGVSEITKFCQQGIRKGSLIFAEQQIHYVREWALVACRSAQGEFRSYPLVVTEQEQGICRLVLGPASAQPASDGLEEQAVSYARSLAEELHFCGTFAIEFFETLDGKLLVNEIAPRVHNSGHFTLDAAVTSQFENHIRAILGMPLGSTKLRPGAEAFAMLNLIGPSGIFKSNYKLAPELQNFSPGFVHWYGKDEVRPGRKMGHINGFCVSAEEVPKLLDRLLSFERSWIQELSAHSNLGQNI